MNRDFNAYENFVCPYCFNTLDKCSCKLFPPYNTIFIDKGIQEHIRVLNQKGYKTIGCCEGHYKGVCINTYIAFSFNYGFVIPDGFKFDKNKNAVHFEYSPKLTKEEMEELKKEKLAVLLEWCKSLDDYKRVGR